MTRLCERPGCSDPAEVAYGFDAEARSVWLDAFAAAQGARSGVLCLRHADAMVVPIGWSLDDRREPVPRLFRPAAPRVAPSPAPSAPRRRSAATDDTQQLQLGGLAPDVQPPGERRAVDAASTEVVEGTPDGEHSASAPPWMPQFDQGDDLAGLLDVQSPLLSRAFTGKARPTTS